MSMDCLLFSERLLVPAGSAGFRITTKIQPFWNIYSNAWLSRLRKDWGLGEAIAFNLKILKTAQANFMRLICASTIFRRGAG